jgi:hypothetical protein
MTAKAEERDLFASLRRFARPRRSDEPRCELCASVMGAEHRHLLEMKSRSIVCTCGPCSILFGNQAQANYRQIPSDVKILPDFVLADPDWDSLSIPINMAFFCMRSGAARPTVYYPSPAGATESLLAIESWQSIVEQNPALLSMEPEVECLLVNRITKPHEYYLAPIDECYRLVGLIRSQWHGFSGGTDVWKTIGAFFTSLRDRAIRIGQTADARTHFSD